MEQTVYREEEERQMELTTRTLSRFVGGQAVIVEHPGPSVIGGVLREVCVTNSRLTLRFRSIYRGVQRADGVIDWQDHAQEEYEFDLTLFSPRFQSSGELKLSSGVSGALLLLSS
jgi:hypothetical protein